MTESAQNNNNNKHSVMNFSGLNSERKLDVEQNKGRDRIENGHWHVCRSAINVYSKTIVQMDKEVQPQVRKRHIVQKKRTR